VNSTFHQFAKAIVARNDANLCDYSADEQVARAVEAMENFAVHAPLNAAVPGHMIDLAGFGSAPVHFENDGDKYLLLSEVAEALGMTPWAACKWAREQHLYAIEDQRGLDEERGDGLLGWECLANYCDLNLWFVMENPEAKPDAGGGRWSDYGDWLISHDRLLALIADSPWSKEFMANMSDLFAHGAKKFFSGGDLANIPAVRMDGNPALHDDGTPVTTGDLFHSDLSEEEARRKARRGPNIPMQEGE
jgi:hypothetical protein